MLDSEISTLCMQKHRQADTFTSDLQKDREDSLKYYNCEPFGDEKDGESKFVTSDVRDTIEWMMPQIVEIFTSDESPVEFLAINAQDVEGAKLETSCSSQDMDEETLQRLDTEGSMRSSATEDGAGRRIEIYEHYIRADLDDSGKTSLWMVKLAGPEGAILLEKEKVDSIPFSAWTPVINCHKFYGMSYADMVRDLQRLRSVLMRQLLNNLYMVNHPAKTVLEGQVYKEDLLNTGPNAIWRVKSPDAIGTHMTPFVGEATLPVLSMVDEMRQERTGVSPASQGLDPSVLADSTNLVGPMIMSQAMQRIKMVARIFAETGFKSLMLRIHELCSKHDHTRTFPIANDYHDVNPREWTKRTQYRVKVGVGHVDKIQRVQAIQAIIGNQTLITQAGGMEGPLLSAGNVYEALVEQAKLLGYVDGAKFYRNPEEYQPPEPQPSEAIQITEATTVADLTKSKASNDIELTKHADEMLLKKQKQDQDYDLAMRKLEQDKELKREEMLLQYGTKAGSNVGFEG